MDQGSHYEAPSVRRNHNENMLLLTEGNLGEPEVGTLWENGRGGCSQVERDRKLVFPIPVSPSEAGAIRNATEVSHRVVKLTHEHDRDFISPVFCVNNAVGQRIRCDITAQSMSKY
jgi:hypothetical protein